MEKKINLDFLSLLCLVFITLKLCKVIAWSWLWVLSPLWGQIALMLLILLFQEIQEFFYKCRLYNESWTHANGKIHWDYKTKQMYDDNGNVINNEEDV